MSSSAEAQLPAKPSGLEPGAIAFVRQRLYLVERVDPPIRAGDATLVSLSCLEDDAQGQPLQVLWEHELDAEVRAADSWDRLNRRKFDPPTWFASYLNTIRWNCVTSTDPNLLQSPFRAGIRLDPYQLEPLRKALRLPRVNLFIADDVGLGKTIEAGLIARELLLRKKASHIVVSCPPSMVDQWREELEYRFGLQFQILDREYIQTVRRQRGFSINPWATHSRFIISHRLLIDETYGGPLRDWLGEFRAGAVLILDEAHHAAPSSGQRYAIDSQITRAVRDLAKRFEHRLFLSATPHNGHSNSFSALLEIMDPQRFCRGVKVVRKNLDDVMVRRLKEDLRRVSGGFPKREVVQVDIEGLPDDAPELALPRLLDEYRQIRDQRLESESKRTQAAAGLLICNLQQRLMSSVEAFTRTLRVHRRGLVKQVQAASPLPAKLDLLASAPGSDEERTEEEFTAEQDVQIEAATALTAGGTATADLTLVDRMLAIAEEYRGQPDARVRSLTDWIRANPDTRVIIFTEWEDTRRYLEGQLRRAFPEPRRIATFTGSTPPGEPDTFDPDLPDRASVKRAFNNPPSEHPVRILIATDAAREGLNLQAHCSHLFHFDVPWNPSRMEQRNGRIDRKLQESPIVHCYYFFHKQRPEDRILTTLLRKAATIREELGSLADVIVEERLASLMQRGISRRSLARLEDAIRSADLASDRKQDLTEELDAIRERSDNRLRENLDDLRNMLEQSRKSVGLDEEHFRAAISCSLQMMGSDALSPAPDDRKLTKGAFPWRFPVIDSTDASWADTMDTLRQPQGSGLKRAEWRAQAPIRPVVFEDPGLMTDKVVQLHLEHRVVQRLLTRFLAQGFREHDLSRACLAQTTDAIPRVILLARLALYGPGAARLHEEIVPVSARWIDPGIRKTPLTPYAREAESRALDLLDKTLLDARTDAIPSAATERLLATASHDVEELWTHLHQRAEIFADEAVRLLSKRGESEAKAMREVLETQRKHIEATVARHDRADYQMKLSNEFEPDEKRQAEEDRKYWQRRLSSLAAELETEPHRIRQLYDVKARRIEPVGLVYLWPVTG